MLFVHLISELQCSESLLWDKLGGMFVPFALLILIISVQSVSDFCSILSVVATHHCPYSALCALPVARMELLVKHTSPQSVVVHCNFSLVMLNKPISACNVCSTKFWNSTDWTPFWLANENKSLFQARCHCADMATNRCCTNGRAELTQSYT